MGCLLINSIPCKMASTHPVTGMTPLKVTVHNTFEARRVCSMDATRAHIMLAQITLDAAHVATSHTQDVGIPSHKSYTHCIMWDHHPNHLLRLLCEHASNDMIAREPYRVL